MAFQSSQACQVYTCSDCQDLCSGQAFGTGTTAAPVSIPICQSLLTQSIFDKQCIQLMMWSLLMNLSLVCNNWSPCVSRSRSTPCWHQKNDSSTKCRTTATKTLPINSLNRWTEVPGLPTSHARPLVLSPPLFLPVVSQLHSLWRIYDVSQTWSNWISTGYVPNPL